MDKPRLEDLGKALEPLQEARAILGDALIGIGADPSAKDQIAASLAASHSAIEQIRLAIGLPLLPLTKEFSLLSELISLSAKLPPSILAETAEFAHACREADRAFKDLPLKEHATTRPTDFKGLPADQRIIALKDALRLLKRAEVALDAAYAAEEENIKRAPDDAKTGDLLYRTSEHIRDALEDLGNAIEPVRVLTGLPPNPLRVLNEKSSALSELIDEQRRLVDAEIPEMQSLRGEFDRLWEQINWKNEDPETKRLKKEIGYLGEEMDRIRETDDKYAEMRRLSAERGRLGEQMDRINEGARPSGFRVINGAGA